MDTIGDQVVVQTFNYRTQVFENNEVGVHIDTTVMIKHAISLGKQSHRQKWAEGWQGVKTGQAPK